MSIGNGLLHYGTSKVVLRYSNAPLCNGGVTALAPKTIRLRFSNDSYDPRTAHPSGCAMCDGTGITSCYYCKGTGNTPCYTCNGSGHSEICTTCNGRGNVGYYMCNDCDGTGYATGVCPSCNGTKTNGTQCSSCSGTGWLQSSCYYCNGSGKYGLPFPDSMTITPVSGVPNTYDFHYDSGDWSRLFAGLCPPHLGQSIKGTCPGSDGTFSVVAGNLTGVTNARYMFDSSGITDIHDLNTSTLTDTAFMFGYCVLLEYIGTMNLRNLQNISGMFYYAMRLKGGVLAIYESLKDKDVTLSESSITPFLHCGYYADRRWCSESILPELDQIPKAWGGFYSVPLTKTIDGNWAVSVDVGYVVIVIDHTKTQLTSYPIKSIDADGVHVDADNYYGLCPNATFTDSKVLDQYGYDAYVMDTDDTLFQISPYGNTLYTRLAQPLIIDP